MGTQRRSHPLLTKCVSEVHVITAALQAHPKLATLAPQAVRQRFLSRRVQALIMQFPPTSAGAYPVRLSLRACARRRLALKVPKTPSASRQILPCSAVPLTTTEPSFEAEASFVVEESKEHARGWPVLSKISHESALEKAGQGAELRKKPFAARRLDFSAAE